MKCASRSAKLVLVVAVLLAAVMTTGFGAAPAGATGLCKANESPCSETNTWGLGAPLEAELASKTELKIASSLLGTFTCGSSTMAGELTDAGGSAKAVKAAIESWSLSSCQLGATPCTATAVNLPYNASISGSGGNGTMTLEDPVGVGANFKCGGSLNCTFTTTSLANTLTGGNPATLSAAAAALGGGACGTAKMTYSWVIPKPGALRVIQVPALLANPCLNAVPNSLSFGSQSVGSTTKFEVEVSNVCGFKVKFKSRTQEGEAFAVFPGGDTCNGMEVGLVCDVEPTFEPFATGGFTGALKYVYNGGELKLPESGTGV